MATNLTFIQKSLNLCLKFEFVAGCTKKLSLVIIYLEGIVN